MTPAPNSSRPFPLLIVLFAASGCSALIYEIVWYQLLELVIGSTTVSLAVLLATFMGGLCLGSLALPRLAAARRLYPLHTYALIELGIAACGVLVLVGMPLVDHVYASAVGHGLPSILLRAIVAAICLLPPTALMGASLPAVARWIEANPEGVAQLGLLYGGNTAGAVLGCLLAGFYLLRVANMTTATFAAVGLNLAVAAASLALARRSPQGAKPEAPPSEAKPVRGHAPVYFSIALSGACALGAEAVWTRLLGLMLGATVYTFSIILAVFLLGLGIGSAAGSMVAGSVRSRTALGYCQLLLIAAIAWTAVQIAQSLPWWPVNALLSTSPWFTFQIDIVRVMWAVLPATLLWGASFPLALAAVSSPGEDSGRMVGAVYAANTFGAILGAVLFSLVLVPSIGTAGAERVLILMAAAASVVILLPCGFADRSMTAGAALALALIGALYLQAQVQPVPGELIAYGRRMAATHNRSKILFTGEGMNSSIAISRWDDGAIQFHVSGKVEASTESYDMRLQRMLGHMPALLHPKPQSVLIVGFGAGVTAGSFVVHPEVRRIVICEMEPLIPPTATRYFKAQNFDVVDDSRTHIVYDDARHFVLTTPETFDIITSDPIHPWVKGSATLYSREYFEMVRAHLNPGGIVTQWVPLYESNVETVKSEIATFFDVFPGATVWANAIDGGGYDIFLLGGNQPLHVNLDRLEARLAGPDYARVKQSLASVGFGSAAGLLSTYAGQAADLATWLSGAEINRDGNLRLQYMAGLAVNTNQENAIYDQMLSYRRFPYDIFQGSSDASLEALRESIAAESR
jgi:spermidine synthase